jgi:bifunctional DNase/RNase
MKPLPAPGWLLVGAVLSSMGCDEHKASPAGLSASTTPATPSASAAHAPRNPREPPRGFVLVRVGGITPTAQGNAVLLVDELRQRALVVFIGDTEALSIQLRLQGTKYKRPLTHDLLDNMLQHLGARVESVRVDRLEDDIFYGVVVVRERDRIHEFDARTSDGIALALGSDAPVFVAKPVLDQAGIELDAAGAPSKEPEVEAVERRPIAL